MGSVPNKKIKNRASAWLVFIVPALFVLIVVSATYFSRGALLSRADQVIDIKINAIRSFVEDPVFSEGIIQHEKHNQILSHPQMMHLDKEWINHPEKSEILSKLLAGELSQKLDQFRSEHTAFKEIFITDRRGLVVALTNPTSDYYQADEDWWTRTFEEGNYIGEIEYDESAQTSFYGIYHQIKDGNGKVIGILKGVLDAYQVRVIGEKLGNL